MKTVTKIVFAIAALVGVAACTTPQVVDHCSARLGNDLNQAISDVEIRLNQGCEYHFDRYYGQLLDIAKDAPDANNRALFSEFLVRVSDAGTITKRQAKELYNRYFNIKFVSFTGDYRTCSQTCPVQAQTVANMQSELQDKELGLMQISNDQQSYYRADHLLKETQLVLEATCRACSTGDAR